MSTGALYKSLPMWICENVICLENVYLKNLHVSF